MIVSMSITKYKEKLIFIFVILLMLVTGVYIYLHFLQDNYNTVQWSGERCLTELTALKYQLNVVTEYKNRIDKMLTETQRAHESDKERFKDVMESCVAMKQQTSICQSQFEDLQTECKKLKENYEKVSKELEKFKVSR